MTNLRALRVVHPFPSAANAVLVAALFLLAGGSPRDAVLLGLGMLALQFCIGATNDLVDETSDSGVKPGKPIPAGLLGPRAVRSIAVLCGTVGLLVYAAFGWASLGFGVAGLGVGLAYDLRLKRAGLGWACFAIAFPLLPLSTWWIAAGTLPPQPGLLLPIAVLAGPALSLSNGLVDLERDEAGAIPTLAVRLGRARSLAVLGVLLIAIYGVALLSLVADPGSTSSVGVALAVLAVALATVGIRLSGAIDPARRERGWQAEVLGLGLLTVAWVAAVT